MATKIDPQQIPVSEILDESAALTLVQLCRTCSVEAETIEAMVEYGVLEPMGQRSHHWYFSANSIKRIHVALRLQRDLGVNLAGVAVVLDLLEQIDTLNARLCASTSRPVE